MFHAFGELDCLNVFSLEKYLLDEEILEARLSVEKKEYITEENIQMDMIKRVGPRGTYMLEDETLELYRTALFHPRQLNCENYHDWQQQGTVSDTHLRGDKPGEKGCSGRKPESQDTGNPGKKKTAA